jgi:hypothetical protein
VSEHDEFPEPGADEAQPPPLRGDDPRRRPPDPAGTQPKFDPADLLPTRQPGALWAEHPIDREAAYLAPRRRPAPAGPTAAAAPVAERRGDTRFAPRFQFITGALLAVAAAAIVLAVLIIVDNSSSTNERATGATEAWSPWQPAANGTDGPTQIAEHVGREYRLPDHTQLVAVTGGPLEIANLPVTVAIRETAAQGGDIKLVDGTGVLYRMCGLGVSECAIPGKPSVERQLLLRREALELALYSFRYLGVEQTVVFLPPMTITRPATGSSSSSSASTEKVNVALLFRRQDADVNALIGRPLSASLVRQTPTVTTVTSSPDAQLVNTVTGSKQFAFSFKESNQDARAFLVLDPLP